MIYPSLLQEYDPRFIELALSELSSPVRYILNVGKTNLSTKLIKSKKASIEIPELEIRILPGIGSKDVICDVYRLLSWIEDSIRMGRIVGSVGRPELLEKMALLKNGEIGATLIIIDPSGKSWVFGEAEKEPINT